MFLTKLVLDPTHPQGRRDLANAYEMHRTLSRVYANGPDTKPARFLWRREYAGTQSSEENVSVLVQSASAGRWQSLPDKGRYALALYPDKVVPLDRLVEEGRFYVFRLRCNPTVTRAGKRYGLIREEDQLAWLGRQGNQHGFSLSSARVGRNERVQFRQQRDGHRITLQVAQFDGLLGVGDPEKFRAALVGGIGHAKALGLGLLSIAPFRAHD